VVGLHIPADPAAPVTAVTVTTSLSGVRQYVGNPDDQPHVEAVGLGGGVHLWVDEDGRANGCPPNARASRLTAGRVLGGDDIRGDALALGSTRDGAEASLTVDDLAHLTARLGVTLTPTERTTP
jgi:hypothetical protein